MRAPLLWLSLILAGATPAPAQCPPGARSCPLPRPGSGRPTPVDVPIYHFRSEGGVPAPWATAVRVSWSVPGSAESVIGSGTILAGGVDGRCVVMTAGHVLRGAPAGQLRVEVFGGPYDLKTGSLGPPTATYPATAIDRDDAHDVGLLRFQAEGPIVGSPLAARGWSPTKAAPLCSVGCSKGEDATARSEAFTGNEPAFLSGWKGTECRPVAIEGRSGGGLFDEAGELVGVCDFSTAQGTGLYAALDSLRAILRKNGLTELADGPGRRPRRPSPEANPVLPEPEPARPPLLIPAREPDIPPAPVLLISILSGLGIGVPGLLAGGWALARKLRRPNPADPVPAAPPAPAPPAPPSPGPTSGRMPGPEELIPILLASIRARADQDRAKAESEAKAKEQTELLDQILKLIAPAPVEPPPKN